MLPDKLASTFPLVDSVWRWRGVQYAPPPYEGGGWEGGLTSISLPSDFHPKSPIFPITEMRGHAMQSGDALYDRKA